MGSDGSISLEESGVGVVVGLEEVDEWSVRGIGAALGYSGLW